MGREGGVGAPPGQVTEAHPSTPQQTVWDLLLGSSSTLGSLVSLLDHWALAVQRGQLWCHSQVSRRRGLCGIQGRRELGSVQTGLRTQTH